MFKTITSKIKRDKDYPLRQYTIDMLTRVLDGTLYDHLEYDFNTEKQNGATGEYIPIRDRRPSVRYGLCKIVVDDSVSLLFSEGHFPTIKCGEDEITRDVLSEIIKETKLNEVMIEAATTGSVGSVSILMRVLEGRIFFSAHNTMFMTPTWKNNAPDTLEKVTEKYKVKGDVLNEMGYTVDKDKTYWFQRIWDDSREIWYKPWDIGEEKPEIVEDTVKTVTHGLGFVPMVWIKNLPGGNTIDGKPTFPNETIDTQIEIDYQLSQAGRGLKYSSDPTLLIKEPAMGNDGQIIKGGGNAIIVSEGGDAKMLEIDGTASTAVIEYVRCLRELAIESAHGNRANADKLSAAQSGRAMELMNQALIWLADRLRISYGEGAMLSLLKMVIKASAKFKLIVDGKEVPALNQKERVTLQWPAWYAPTIEDMSKRATTLRTLCDAGLLSRETAIKVLAAEYDIEDAKAEKLLADADMKERNQAAKVTAAIQE
jgi:hypothetical protein